MALWIIFAVFLGLALIWLVRPLTAAHGHPTVLPQENGPFLPMSARARRWWALGSCVFTTAFVLTFYLYVGSPQNDSAPYRDKPKRLSAESDLVSLVAAAESKLLKSPEDIGGWSALAPAYAALGRFSEAQHAYEQALRLAPMSAPLLAGYGQMLISQANGVVGTQAESLLQQAYKLDATLIMPRYYLGLARAQDGDTSAALAIWETLLVDVTKDESTGAPFRHMLQRKIQDMRRIPGESSRPNGES